MGRQFADDSMTPEPISVSRDEYKDEIPSDRPYAENCTPGHSNPLYTGRQYSDDWNGGYRAYGKSVGAAPKASVVGIEGDKANRGPEN